MNAVQQNPHKIKSSSCILNILCVMDLLFTFLILLEEHIQLKENQMAKLYFCQKRMKHNEFSVRFITYTPSLL